MPSFTHPNVWYCDQAWQNSWARFRSDEKKKIESQIPCVRLWLWQWRRCVRCCVIVYASVLHNLLLGFYFRVLIVLHNDFEYSASLLFRIVYTFQCHRNYPSGNVFVASLQLTFDWNIYNFLDYVLNASVYFRRFTFLFFIVWFEFRLRRWRILRLVSLFQYLFFYITICHLRCSCVAFLIAHCAEFFGRLLNIIVSIGKYIEQQSLVCFRIDAFQISKIGNGLDWISFRFQWSNLNGGIGNKYRQAKATKQKTLSNSSEMGAKTKMYRK